MLLNTLITFPKPLQVVQMGVNGYILTCTKQQCRAYKQYPSLILPPFLNICLFRGFKWTTTYGCIQTYFRVQIHSFCYVCSPLLKSLERQIFRNGGSICKKKKKGIKTNTYFSCTFTRRANIFSCIGQVSSPIYI